MISLHILADFGSESQS